MAKYLSVQTFKSADKILRCYHSNLTRLAELLQSECEFLEETSYFEWASIGSEMAYSGFQATGMIKWGETINSQNHP